MKVFDLSQLKKTARIKQSGTSIDGASLTNNRSYTQIHKSPTKSSIRESVQESFYLSRWGKNIDGKTNQKNQNIPWTNVGQGIIATSVGEQHVLIVNNKHQCFGYGSNHYGQLSLEGDIIHRPTQLSSFKQMKIVNIVCGSYHSFVQNSKGEVYGFGMNIKGQLGIGSNQSRRKPSLIYSLLPNGSKNPKSNFFIETTEYKRKLKKNKEQGTQLSNITNLISKISTQTQCDSNKLPTFLLNSDEAIKSMACGPLHSLMLSNKNRIFASGYGQKFSLGTAKNKSTNQFVEVRIKGGTPSKIQKIECGVSTSGFLAEGKVYISGTLDNKVYEYFTPLNFSDEVVDFKLGVECVVVLNRKGEVYRFGKINSTSLSSDSFVKINDFQRPVKNIFAGMTCFFALTDIGTCYGWGDNTNKQITGLAEDNEIENPKMLKIPIYTNETISIVCGNGTTFLLSGKPLESPSKKTQQIQNEQQISSFIEQIPLKTSVSQIQLKRKNTTSKYSHSNIYKTEERNLLSEMGIKPRTFNISMEIDFSQLVIQSQISEGGYGIIYKGLWRQTTVAIKMFKIQSQNGVKDFFSECAAMEALRHPNIVMFLGACTKPPNFAIVLQYCGKGSLWSTIQNLQTPLTWQQRRRFALQTAKGVNYLHTSTPPIIHRDLKSLNLLLDDSYRVKLADFGWTKGLDNYMTGKIGTYQWMAPQVIASQKYSQKADVFSYGIILWQIASRQPPFKNLSGLQVSMQVLNNDMRPKIPKNCPQCFVKLMKKCWDRQPSKRPSFKQIIKQLQSMKF